MNCSANTKHQHLEYHRVTLKLKRLPLFFAISMIYSSTVFGDDHSFWSSSSPEKNQYMDIPDLAGGVGLINRQQERMIGEKVLREVRLKLPNLDDPWLEDEINRIFASIYSQTSLGQPIALVMVRDQQINAFAVPGGLFAINAGLITSARNIDEIAGVMAHEIAHVTQRHYSRSREAFKGQGLLSLAGLLAGIVLATQAPDAGAAVMVGTQAAMLDKQLTYSRNQEREADRIGMQYMSIAGYDPNSMADFFEVMHRSSSQLSYLPDFWLTHPLSTERMSEARLRARQYQSKSTNQQEKQLKFEMIRWRVAVLAGYANLNQLKLLADRNNGAALALATHYIEQSQYNEAKIILDKFEPHEVEKGLYHLIMSDWYKAQKQYQQAIDYILPYYRVTPENRTLLFQISELYILNQQPTQAKKILQPLTTIYPRDVKVWQLLQQAEYVERSNPIREINVLRYRAEVQFWSGYEDEAIRSLLHAQRLVKNNESLKYQIDGRLKKMQEDRQLKL